MNADISVVIPTYNGARFIREALESVFTQTLLPKEIIVVDDASTDETPDIIASIAKTAPVPMRIIRLIKNSGGPAHPLNIGIKESNYDLIALLEQDDRMVSNRLERQASFLFKESGLPLVFGLEMSNHDGGLYREKSFYGSDDVLVIKHRKVSDDEYVLDAHSFYVHTIVYRNFINGSNAMFRKKAWQAIGGISNKYRISWDCDFACRLSSIGAIAFVNQIIKIGCRHKKNLSGDLLSYFCDMVALEKQHLMKPVWPLDETASKTLQSKLAGGYLFLGYLEAIMGNALRSISAYRHAYKFGADINKCVINAFKIIPHKIVHSYPRFFLWKHLYRKSIDYKWDGEKWMVNL